MIAQRTGVINCNCIHIGTTRVIYVFMPQMNVNECGSNRSRRICTPAHRDHCTSLCPHTVHTHSTGTSKCTYYDLSQVLTRRQQGH